jgi:hypothetical protein
MAENPAGDIVGARFAAAINLTHASVASDGAGADVGRVGPFGHPGRATQFFWTPTGADNAASMTASYRRLTLVNVGADGAGTTILGSLNLTASKASLAPIPFVMASNGSFASGDALVVKHATVGGNHANGTVLVAGQFGHLEYEAL